MGTKRKKEQKFTREMQIKLMAIFAFVLLLLVALNLVIAHINVTNGDKYAKQVLSQQTYDSRTIPFRRGEIQDRNGNVLAKSEKVYNVVLDCEAINSVEDYVEPTIAAVSEVFDLDSATVRECICGEETKESRYQVIKKEISLEEKQAFEDYTDISEDRNLSEAKREELNNIQGVWFEEDYVRTYPMDTLACTVIGFANKLNDGISGLESYYTEILNGVDGREYGYLNQDMELEENIIEPEDGNSIVSTIDMNIQQVVEKYIAQLEEENKNGPREKTAGHASLNTGVIVANPNNGEILAMATDKTFNLNDPQNLDGWYSEKEQKTMTEEEKSEALSSLWYNFCVSEAFELGSTYKPNVVAAALDSGSITEDFGMTCIGYLQPLTNEDPIACTGTHGEESIKDIIRNSCNPGMMTIGFQMGIDTFCKYQDIFGFGKRTGIDLPNENAGYLYNTNTMGTMELATCSFGQGFTATMIQEVQSFCADINGGYLYKPHIVKQILDSDGGVVRNINPLVMAQPVSSKTSALIREYLEAVVTDGTATSAAIPGYRIGGKTGTAEKLPRGDGRYIISFICAVPIDDPQVVVYTVIDEPNIEDQENGSYTKDLARNILTEILPYLGIYPTEEITEEERQSLGIQVEKEGGDTQWVSQYVYDEYGNIVYDETTWEPMTEMVEVDENGNVVSSESEDTADDNTNLYGNVAPPEPQGEEQIDENWSDGVTNQDLQIGMQ